MTILSIAQKVAKRLMLPSPATLVGNTDNNVVLISSMMLETIESIRDEYGWPELQKAHLFYTIANLEWYALPLDFNRTTMETLWNRTQRWPLIGPLNGVEWQTYKSGLIVSYPRQRFRCKGWSNSQFFIDPTPSETDLLVFEYISESAIRPKTWAPSTAYTSGTYVSYDGIIFKCSTSGTSHTVQPPAFGKDGTMFWSTVPTYVAALSYYVDQYVYANSKVYQCTVAGKGGVAPSVTSGTEVTGTCTFEYIATPATWVAGTTYTQGTFVKSTGGGTNCYLALVNGTSGDYSPKFYSTLVDSNIPLYPTLDQVSDGTAVWDVYYSPFNAFVADTDEVILDNQLIEDGTVWRFKRERGLEYEGLMNECDERLQFTKSKLQGSGVLTIGSRNTYPPILGVLNYPDGNY